MPWTALRHSWLLLAPIAFVACIPDTVEMDSGNTTTTYGTTTNSSSSTSGNDGDEVNDTGDGVPPDPSDSDTDPTDDPPDPSDSGPDPSDSGPDPSDSGPPPLFDLPPEPGLPNGTSCTFDDECSSHNCYVVPFLGGQCGECNEDADCATGGCTPPNPFENLGSHCNMGEPGGGCESDDVCADDLSCANVLDLLGLIVINTCSECLNDNDCGNGQICAPIVDVSEFTGQRQCIPSGSLPQDSYCDLEGNGTEACASGICSTIDIMGLAQVGACGECNSDNDCGNGSCVAGEFILDNGTLFGSTCQ